MSSILNGKDPEECRYTGSKHFSNTQHLHYTVHLFSRYEYLFLWNNLIWINGQWANKNITDNLNLNCSLKSIWCNLIQLQIHIHSPQIKTFFLHKWKSTRFDVLTGFKKWNIHFACICIELAAMSHCDFFCCGRNKSQEKMQSIIWLL